jgi:hypothetical protein
MSKTVEDRFKLTVDDWRADRERITIITIFTLTDRAMFNYCAQRVDTARPNAWISAFFVDTCFIAWAFSI